MNHIMQDPLANYHMSEGIDNQQKLAASEYGTAFWANEGLDINRPFSTQQKVGQVWEAGSVEAEQRKTDYLEGINEEYAKSMVGVGTEALKQVGVGMGGTLLDVVNVAVGSKALSDYVYTMRKDAQQRMAVYEDDTMRRNVIGAASSIGQLFGWRGVGLATGAAVAMVPGLQGAGAIIAGASLAPVSIGFGLSTWSEQYHEGKRLGLSDDEASARAVSAGMITGVSTYGLGKYFDAGLATMLSKKNAGKAAELGFAKALEVSKHTNIGDAVMAGAKNYSVEVGQEFIELAGHLVNDKYHMDRDISAQELGMMSTDIMLSMLMTIPTMQAGGYAMSRGAQMPVRNADVIRAANDSFHLLNGQTDKAMSAKDLTGVVDYIITNDVDIAAVSDVLHQFIGPSEASVFNRQIATKVQERKIQDAVAKQKIAQQRHDDSVAAFEQFENDLEKSLFQVPQSVIEGMNALDAAYGMVEPVIPDTPRVEAINKNEEAKKATALSGNSDIDAINKVIEETMAGVKVKEEAKKKAKTSVAAAETAPEVVMSKEDIITNLTRIKEGKLKENPKAGIKGIDKAIEILSSAKTPEEEAKALQKANTTLIAEQKYFDAMAKYRVEAEITNSNILSMLSKEGEEKTVVETGEHIPAGKATELFTAYGRDKQIPKIQSAVRQIVQAIYVPNIVEGTTDAATGETVDADAEIEAAFREDYEDAGVSKLAGIYGTSKENRSYGVSTEKAQIKVLSPFSKVGLDKLADKVFKDLYEEVPISRTKDGEKKTNYIYVPKFPGSGGREIASSVHEAVVIGAAEFDARAEALFSEKEITLDTLDELNVPDITAFISRVPKEEPGKKTKNASKGLKQKAELAAKYRAEIAQGINVSENTSKLIGGPVQRKSKKDPDKLVTIEVKGIEQSIREDVDALPLNSELRDRLYRSIVGAPIEVQEQMEPVQQIVETPQQSVEPKPEKSAYKAKWAKDISKNTVDRLLFVAQSYKDKADFKKSLKETGTLDGAIAELESKYKPQHTNAQEAIAELRAINRKMKEEREAALSERPPYVPVNPVVESADKIMQFVTAELEGLSEEARATYGAIFHGVSDELAQLKQASGMATVSQATIRFGQRALEGAEYAQFLQHMEDNDLIASKHYGGGLSIDLKIGTDTVTTGEVDPATGQVTVYPDAIVLAAKRYNIKPEVLEAATVAHEKGHIRVPSMFEEKWQPGDDAPAALTSFMQKAWLDAQSIPSLRSLVNETKLLYGNDITRIRKGSNLEAFLGEEMIMRLGERMVVGNIENKQKLQRSSYGLPVFDPQALSLWNRFKLIVSQALIKTGIAEKFKIKLSANDIDFFAFKLMQDWIKAPNGIAQTKPGEIKRVYGGDVYKSLIGLESKVLHVGSTWEAEPGRPQGRPRLDMIGTGEGNVTFGWGFYAAQSPGVHRSYFTAAEHYSANMYINGKKVSLDSLQEHERLIFDLYNKHKYGGGRQAVLEELNTRQFNPEVRAKAKAELSSFLNSIEFRPVKPTAYALEIPDADMAKFIDLDKQITTENFNKLKTAWDRSNFPGVFPVKENMTGKEAYDSFAGLWSKKTTENKKYTSQFFDSADIPGNVFLDATSRQRGSGTKNVVVWNQDVLDRTAITEMSTTSALQSKLLAPTIEVLDKLYGADARLDELLINTANNVLGLSNSIGKEVSIGEFYAEVKRILGEDLNLLTESKSIDGIKDYLDDVFGRAVTEFKQYTKTDEKTRQILDLKKKIGVQVSAVRKGVPTASRQDVADAIYQKMIPKGEPPVDNLYEFIYNTIDSTAEREMARYVKDIHDMGFNMTPAMADAVRTVYEEDWNIGYKKKEVPLRMIQKAQELDNIGRRTEAEVLDDLDEVNSLLQRAEAGDTTVMNRKDLYTIQNALRFQLTKLHQGEVHVPKGSLEAFKMKASYLWSNLLRYATIESSMRKEGMDESVIQAVKASGSVKTLIVERMTEPLMLVARAVQATGDMKQTVMKHAVLHAEAHPDYLKNVFAKLPGDVQAAVSKVSPLVINFYQTARDIIGQDYGGELDFQKHKIMELEREAFALQNKLKKAKAEGKKNSFTAERKRIAELYDRIGLLKATNFVSIASMFMKDTKTQSEYAQRTTLTLYGLLSEKSKSFVPGFSIDDVHTTDILSDYISSVANDAALSNVAKAVKESNHAVKTRASDSIPVGWADGKTVAPVFNGYALDARLADTIITNVNNPRTTPVMRRVRTIFNIAKAKEFLNPAMMPALDVMQGAMIGVFPTPAGWKKAKADLDDITQDYIDAVHKGAHSTPNTYPNVEILRRRARTGSEFMGKSIGEVKESLFANMLLSKNAVREYKEGDINGMLASAFSENFVTAMYAASKEYAWYWDGVLKQMGYNQLKARGYSADEAAKMVARTYADYADMPVPTRRAATLVAFTPIYAFETMMALGRNAQDTVNLLRNVQKGKSSPDAMALGMKSMVATFVGSAAVEALMLMSGYERDEEKWWDTVLIGRKFKKDAVTKDGMEKEIHLRIGTPFSMLFREFDRFAKITDVETLWEVPGATVKALGTLQHPLFRNAANLINLTNRRGEPIWNEHDPTGVKYGKAAMAFAGEWVPLLGTLIPGAGFVDDEAREAATGNWSKFGGQFLNVLYFPYLTDPYEKRLVNKMKAQTSMYLSTIKKLYQENGTADPRVLKGLENTYNSNMEELQTLLTEEHNKSR